MNPIPYPKMLYHPKTGVGTIVQNEGEHEKLLEAWTTPEAEAKPADDAPTASKEKTSPKSAA